VEKIVNIMFKKINCMKKLLTLVFVLFIFVNTIIAQATFSNDADEPKIKEMQNGIAKLVNYAADNFANIKGNVLTIYKAYGKWVTRYEPKDLSVKMYTDDANITEEHETKKNYYSATYNNNASIKLAYSAFLTMNLKGKEWTRTSVPSTEKNTIKDLLFLNGQQVGVATNNPSKNELYITIEYIDSVNKLNKEYYTILEFMSQFDSIDMGNWKFDAENNAADVKNLQQSIMLLIGQGVLGFSQMKNGIYSTTSERIYYYTKPNILMKASVEYIIEKNSKNSYGAYYNNEIEKELSLQAFLAMPSFNKSTVPLRVEKAKLVNNAIEKTRYNLYLSDKLAASYFINKNDNSIQVYEPGY